MSDVITHILTLLSGYGFVQFVILGVIGCLLAASLSFCFNILRALNHSGGERRTLMAAALPGGLLLLLAPLVLSGVLHDFEFLLVPAALILMVVLMMTHRKLLRLSRTVPSYEGLHHGWLDGAMLLLGGVSLGLLILPRVVVLFS